MQARQEPNDRRPAPAARLPSAHIDQMVRLNHRETYRKPVGLSHRGGSEDGSSWRRSSLSERLAHHHAWYAWSGDGIATIKEWRQKHMDISALRQLIAERDSISVLETVDVHTGIRSVLKEFDYVIEAPNWTQDGSALVYNSRGHMYTYALATGEISEIDTGFAIDCNNDHVLSPDNAQLAVSHFTNEDATSRIYVLPMNGGSPVLVTEKGPSYLHGWSPDGKRLAYCAARGGQYDIYTISVNGGPETQLTDMPGLDDGPEYAPDGNAIWFNSTRTGLMQIWRMEIDGSNPVQVVHEDANCWFPHVSPNGRWVVYIAYGKNDVHPGDHPANKHVELRLVPADGGETKPIVTLFGGQGTMNVNSWSPDNRTIAFVSYRLKQ
jgi:TolB protein